MKRINHQPLITFQMAQVMFAHYNSENYKNNIVYVWNMVVFTFGSWEMPNTQCKA